MSRGELIIDDNQVKPVQSGDWASEYQQQNGAGPSWADEFAHEQASIELITEWHRIWLLISVRGPFLGSGISIELKLNF